MSPESRGLDEIIMNYTKLVSVIKANRTLRHLWFSPVKAHFFHRMHHIGILFIICQAFETLLARTLAMRVRKETLNPQTMVRAIIEKLNPADSDGWLV